MISKISSPKVRYAFIGFFGVVLLVLLLLAHELFFKDVGQSNNGSRAVFKAAAMAVVFVVSVARVLDIMYGLFNGYVVSLFHLPPRARVYHFNSDFYGFLFHIFAETLCWLGLAYNLFFQLIVYL